MNVFDGPTLMGAPSPSAVFVYASLLSDSDNATGGAPLRFAPGGGGGGETFGSIFLSRKKARPP